MQERRRTSSVLRSSSWASARSRPRGPGDSPATRPRCWRTVAWPPCITSTIWRTTPSSTSNATSNRATTRWYSISRAEENLQARIRGNLLMALSNKFGWLVLTTGNKSEMSVGYATLYGDMAGGFAVLKDVPKTWVCRPTTCSTGFLRPTSRKIAARGRSRRSVSIWKRWRVWCNSWTARSTNARRRHPASASRRARSARIGACRSPTVMRREREPDRVPPGSRHRSCVPSF